ncbi:hypothetical protein [Dietzia timorensis]|nr:hypothetical protein [Dietzia timorensis]
MTTSLTMVEANLGSAQLQDFLAAHLAEMAPAVPGSSQHALGARIFSTRMCASGRREWMVLSRELLRFDVSARGKSR